MLQTSQLSVTGRLIEQQAQSAQYTLYVDCTFQATEGPAACTKQGKHEGASKQLTGSRVYAGLGAG